MIRCSGAARYVRLDETMAAIGRAGIDKVGLVGNEKFRKTIE